MTSKVWVVQEGQNNYDAAEDFGEVNFITDNDISKIVGCAQNIYLGLDIKRFLSEYTAGIDYIIPAGNPMVIALITMSLPTGNHQFLKWDGRRSVYIPYNISPIK